MKKLIVLSLLISSILSSCKKYEEDEGIQLSSAKQRIARDWVIAAYYENEQDKTSFYNSRMPNYTLSISKNGKWLSHAEGNYKIGNYNVPIEINESGDWEFGMNKKNLILNYKNGGVMPYVILKLSKTEFWCSELNAPEKEYRFKAK